jgi:hypothetical protein
MKTRELEVKKVRRFGKIRSLLVAMVSLFTVTMLAVSASATTPAEGLKTAFDGINLTELVLEPIFVIIPMAIPITLTIIGLMVAIGLFRKLLRG